MTFCACLNILLYDRQSLKHHFPLKTKTSLYLKGDFDILDYIIINLLMSFKIHSSWSRKIPNSQYLRIS